MPEVSSVDVSAVEFRSRSQGKEGPKMALKSPEAQRNFETLSPRVQRNEVLGMGNSLLQRVQTEGNVFITPEQQAIAQKGLLYRGGETTKEVSDQLEAYMDSLRAVTGEEAAQIVAFLNATYRIQIEEGATAKLLTYQEWQKELADPATSETRKTALENGLHGFEKLPKNPDELISENLSKLEQKLQNNQSLTKQERKAYSVLKLASLAKGEYANLLKLQALKKLREIDGDDPDLNFASVSLGRESQAHAEKFVSEVSLGLGKTKEEISKIFEQQGPEAFLTKDMLSKMPWLEQKMLGRGLAPAEIENILKGKFASQAERDAYKQKHGDGVGLALLFEALVEILLYGGGGVAMGSTTALEKVAA